MLKWVLELGLVQDGELVQARLVLVRGVPGDVEGVRGPRPHPHHVHLRQRLHDARRGGALLLLAAAELARARGRAAGNNLVISCHHPALNKPFVKYIPDPDLLNVQGFMLSII